jgi:hypothetical protein
LGKRLKKYDIKCELELEDYGTEFKKNGEVLPATSGRGAVKVDLTKSFILGVRSPGSELVHRFD